MNNFIVGIRYFLDGFALIRKPILRRFVYLPLLVNMVFFIGLFFLLHHYVGRFNIWLAEMLPAWLQWVDVVFGLLFFIAFSLVFVYTFAITANLLASPFNSLMSEEVEKYLTGQTPDQRGLLANLKDVPRILGRQAALLSYYVPRALLIFILFFIPVIHVAAMMLWLLFNAWFMALSFIDYPTDNHRVPLRDVRRWLVERRLTSFGFGLAVLAAMMIPIVNFFVIPAAVAGATKYWVEASK